MPKTIKLTFEHGTVLVETQGFVGKACKDATADLERALGMKTSDRNTPEFEQKHVQSQGT